MPQRSIHRRVFILGGLTFGRAAVARPAPQRIVSISPATTEILYGIGAFSRVVADTDYCTYPPEAKALPKVGGWATPSVERVAAFHPDLVVFSDAQVPFLQKSLEQLGIPIAIAPSQTIHDTFQAIEILGKATANEREATLLAADTKAVLDAVQRRAAGLPRPAVLCVVDRTPGTLRDLYAALPGSFLAELIAMAGGKVVGGTTRSGYGRLSQEAVLTANPDLILDLVASNAAAHPEQDWRELSELKAVRTGNVRAVREDYVSHASQRVAWTAALFARLLHPEVPPREWPELRGKLR